MNISEVKIEGFRGLKLASKLNRINIVVGENGSGKTSFLEAIFISTLFQSDISNNDVNNFVGYVLNSRGDRYSALYSLSNAKVTLDNVTTQFKKVDPSSIDVEINNEKVAEIRIKTGYLLTDMLYTSVQFSVVDIIKRVEGKYSPIYISTFFDNYGSPEIIYSIAKRKNNEKIKSDLEILQDEFGLYRLYYRKLPAYVMGRGLLKRELIRLSLVSSSILLIDEIENSLHPDLVMKVLKDIKDAKNTQVIFTTHVNEVIKMASMVFDSEEVQVLYLSKGGYKTYQISEISEFEKPLSWLGYV